MIWKAARNRKQSGSHRGELPGAEFFVQQEPDLGRLDLVLPETSQGAYSRVEYWGMLLAQEKGKWSYFKVSVGEQRRSSWNGHSRKFRRSLEQIKYNHGLE